MDKLIAFIAAIVVSAALAQEAGAAEHTERAPAAQTIILSVSEQGFTPSRIRVKKGSRVDLVITRKTDQTCATAISFPDYGIKRDLPLNQPVTISITPKKSGEMKYSCAMGMMGGALIVE